MEIHEIESLKEQIRKEILTELSNAAKLKEEQEKHRKEEERKVYEEYVARMERSPEPWVDIKGWSETDTGIQVELNWNKAFIDQLKRVGIFGYDEEQMVQKWLALLMKEVDQQHAENTENESDYA